MKIKFLLKFRFFYIQSRCLLNYKEFLKIVIFLGIIFIWGSHPLLIIGGLVILVLATFLYLYYRLTRFWVGYLLVLVILRGILVIFSYILRLIPNLAFEEFNLFIPILMLIFILYSFLDKIYLSDLRSYCYVIWSNEIGIITFYLVRLLLLLIVIVLFLRIIRKGSLRVY